MNSGSHRGFTVVTIITLIFTQFFTHNHWVQHLTSVTRDTQTVACVANKPCPAHETIVKIVQSPLPPDPPKHR